MSELDVKLAGKSLADFTNTQLRLALGAVLYTNTADMWKRYLNQLGYSGDVSQMLQKYYVEYSVPQNFRNYINAGAFIYSPQQLFSDGSKGVVYDNNDLSSFYLDSAGVTPATVNGLVGLQLDKSGNLALGAELTTNGDFASDTWWTKSDVTVTISGGTGNFTASTANQFLSRTALLVVGGLYEITYTVTSISVGGVRLHDGSGYGPTRSTTGTYTERWLAVGANFYFVTTGASTTASIDNVSVKRVQGNHRYQTTTGSKPVLRGTPTGANLVTNGDFASDTWWTKGADWVISGGVASRPASASFSNLSRSALLTIGNVYRVELDIVAISGTVNVLCGGASSQSFTTTGRKVAYLPCAGDTAFYIQAGNAATTCTIDNVTIYDVSAGQVTAPYGLQYDGVDDFMQTAAVDFTATDKMFVCAGVRQIATSGSVGMLIEHSVNADSTANTFKVDIEATTAKLRLGIYGTAAGGNITETASPAIPRLSVITGTWDKTQASAATQMAMRLNGVLATTTAAFGANGTATFSNNAIYFGRRGGTSLPYTGLDFGFVIVGKTLTSTQISQTERYIAQRTGVTI